MKRSKSEMLAGLFVLALILAGCGSEGGTTNDGGTVNPGTELFLFIEDVKSCTPYLSDSSPSQGVYELEEWNGWDPQATDTVLGILFDPGIGEEACLYAQIEKLDSHIEMANIFADRWDTSGTYTDNGITAIVDTEVTTVSVPYLGFEYPYIMDRLVTLNVPAQDLTIHMAFAQSGGNQTIIEQYSSGTTTSGAYIAQVQGNKIKIWHASVSGDSGRKVQFIWEGNTNDETFRITECTNAAGLNWEAMGGGDVSSSAGEMAFIARNNATSLSASEYYLTITSGDLAGGREQSVIAAADVPPGNTGALAYINEDNSLCLGFLGEYEYPDNVDELAWED